MAVQPGSGFDRLVTIRKDNGGSVSSPLFIGAYALKCLMNITQVSEKGVMVLALSGRMDETATGDFDNAAKSALEENTSILVDLKDLVYISSAGLRSLLSFAKMIKGKSGRLGFCSLQPMVAEVFHISGFDRMLSVYEDKTAALVAFTQ